MDIFSIYIATFFIVFLIIPTVYFVLRLILWFFLDYCGWCGSENRNRRANNRNRSRNVRQQIQQRRYQDRQGNIYTVSDDIASNNVPPRFADFFYLESGSEDAARIRAAQIEKDDKELPSYEEVLRMTALTPPPAATIAALPATMPPMPPALGVSNTSFAITSTDLPLPPAPPYTEIDINATMPIAANVAPQPMTSISTATPTSVTIAPSTSRAAASLVITNPVAAVTTSTAV